MTYTRITNIIICAVFFITTNSFSIIDNNLTSCDNNFTLSDKIVQKKIEKLHEHLWKYFIHPETDLIYDYIAPLHKKDRWDHLPSPEEIFQNKPNPAGWGTGMEDCAMNGGAYLVGLIYRYEVTKKEEHSNDARRIFSGLIKLGTVPGKEGFIPRAFLPDGKTYYPNSSTDQYTLYIFGLWSYYNSDIATEKEKETIEKVVNDICKRIVDDNYEILSATDEIAQYCDVGAITPDRSSRLLQIFLTGYQITKNRRWLDIYNEKVKEDNYARLKAILDPSGLKKYATYSILQNQVSIVPLFYLDSLITHKTCYFEALKTNAEVVSERIAISNEYTPNIHNDNYNLGGWREGKEPRPAGMNDEYRIVRVPGEAMYITLLANDLHLFQNSVKKQDKQQNETLREQCINLLSKYDYEKMRTFGFLYDEIVYWLAVKQGLLEYTP